MPAMQESNKAPPDDKIIQSPTTKPLTVKNLNQVFIHLQKFFTLEEFDTNAERISVVHTDVKRANFL
jgi:hypothetical protein